MEYSLDKTINMTFCLGSFDQIATMPIYGKTLQTSLRNKKVNDLGCWYLVVGSVCIIGDNGPYKNMLK